MSPALLPSVSSELAAFGEPATITPVGGVPVSTDIIWLPPTGGLAIELDARLAAQPRCGVQKSAVSVLPPGSTIVAAVVPGGTLRTFVVDRTDTSDPQWLIAVVH